MVKQKNLKGYFALKKNCHLNLKLVKEDGDSSIYEISPDELISKLNLVLVLD